MTSNQAFGGMLQELVSLDVFEFRSEPLDAIVERRLKNIWEQTPCPECEATVIQTWDDLDRIWCRGCGFMSTYTLGTPFYNAELAPGEFLVAFIMYADSLLSINQIASLMDRAYNTVHSAIREVEARSSAASPSSGTESITRSTDRHRSTKHSKRVRATKVKTHRGTVCPAGVHQKADAHAGVETKETS